MTPFRISRQRRGPDPFLRWKVGLFVVGATFGVAGMITENGVILGIGVIALAAGVGLRLFRPAGEADDEEEE